MMMISSGVVVSYSNYGFYNYSINLSTHSLYFSVPFLKPIKTPFSFKLLIARLCYAGTAPVMRGVGVSFMNIWAIPAITPMATPICQARS